MDNSKLAEGWLGWGKRKQLFPRPAVIRTARLKDRNSAKVDVNDTQIISREQDRTRVL
jgi:hypothetical protein